MVGTFYRAPAPDAAPYVEVGDTVSEGDVVLILEAMKMQNNLTAPASGKVKSIPHKAGTAVEKNEVLMVFETA